MIYLILGGTNCGKTSFVMNSFLNKKDVVEQRDLIDLTYSGNNVLFGSYDREGRRKGLDTIGRTHIPLIIEQIKKVLKEYPEKDLVLEGDRLISKKLFKQIQDLGVDVKMYLLKTDLQKLLDRNKQNVVDGIDPYLQKESTVKSTITRSENMFYDYVAVFNGEVIDTNDLEDFSKLSINNYPEPKEGKMRKDFAVFILTHGRADRVITYKTLKKINYTGKIYIVIDNEDKSAQEYYDRYGDDVIMFDKLEASKDTDTADNDPDRRAVVFARNKVHEIAKDLGLQYFLVLDDDYNNMWFRVVKDGKLGIAEIKDADTLFEHTLEFLDVSGALSVAYAQAGDFIGGVDSGTFHKGILRKAMNVWFCRTDRPFKFYGKINEDATTYVYLGGQGELFFTLTKPSIDQNTTQAKDGGLTDIYLDLGTYVKSFYSVIYNPSCVKVAPMGDKHRRLHHRVNWTYAVPKIIREEHRRGYE